MWGTREGLATLPRSDIDDRGLSQLLWRSVESALHRIPRSRPLHAHEKGIEFSAQGVNPGFRSAGESSVLVHRNQDSFGCVVLCDHDDTTLHGLFQQEPKFILCLSGRNQSAIFVSGRHDLLINSYFSYLSYNSQYRPSKQPAG